MPTQAQFNTTAPSGSDQHWIVPASTGAPVLILSASQEQRAHASIFNDAVGTLFLKFGSDAGMGASGSAQIYDVKLTSASYYEIPKPVWQGEIWGIWDTAGGWARVMQVGTDK